MKSNSSLGRSLESYELPLPDFYNPDKVGELWIPDYGDTADKAAAFAKMHKIVPAARDMLKICTLAIDNQIGFCLKGRPLFVLGRSGTGAVDDTRRATEFTYRNARVITRAFATMDTHTAWQIFHPTMWINDAGQHPAPFTMFSVDDVESGKWRINPVAAFAITGNGAQYPAFQQHALHYVRELAKKGKYLLTIWPYHCLLGSLEHPLVPSYDQALFFHNILRGTQSGPEIKGGSPLFENYSILAGEVLVGANGESLGQRNTLFLQKLLTYDAVIVYGQAKSHCVAWTIDDLLTDILKIDPSGALAKKVYLVEDLSSAVVVPGVIDFTDQANEAFEKFRAAGMNVVKSTDPIHTWPGIEAARLAV